MSRPSHWRFVPAMVSDVRRWTYGTITSRADLYSARIFGATSDYRCECGNLDGESAVEQTCNICGVTVVNDSTLGRRKRLGDMKISARCENPLTRSPLFMLPILPISYRKSNNGMITAIGHKYELLVDLNLQIAAREDRKSLLRHEELQQALNNLFGQPDLRLDYSQWQDTTIAELLHRSVFGVCDDVDVIFRAAGLAIEIAAVL